MALGETILMLSVRWGSFNGDLGVVKVSTDVAMDEFGVEICANFPNRDLCV